jgi:hypothetical protein
MSPGHSKGGCGPDRRAERRYGVLWEGRLAVSGRQGEIAGVVGDISRHGVKFRTFDGQGIGSRLRAGETVQVHVKSAGWLSAAVQWCAAEAAGLKFVDTVVNVDRMLADGAVAAQ